MSCWHRCWFTASAALVLLLGQASPIWAQPPGAEPESQETWVIGYALVIFSVGLGLFVVCRPSRRNKQVKAEKK